MVRPKISIIVPVYNTGKFLCQCVKSLIINDVCSQEIILVDDGSENETARTCDRLADLYVQVRVIHQKNSGVSVARNVGIENASGEFVMFVDSDDYLENSLVSDLINSMEDFDLGIAGYSLYDDINNIKTNIYSGVKRKGSIYDLANTLEDFINPPYILGPCFKLFRLSIIKEHNIRFPLNISYCEDALFVFEYLLYTNNYVSIENSGYCYRKHGNETLSSSFRPDLFKFECMLNEAIECFLIKNNIKNGYLLTYRLFKAFVHYLHKLACSSMSDNMKVSIIQSVVYDFDLKMRFKSIEPRSLDDYISCNLIKKPTHILWLKFMKFELFMRSLVKSIAIKPYKYV